MTSTSPNRLTGTQISTNEALVTAALRELQQAGFAPESLEPGKISRFGKKKEKWCAFFTGITQTGREYYAGAYGDWSTGEKYNLHSKSGTYSNQDRAEIQEQIQKAKEDAQRARESEYERAAVESREKYSSLSSSGVSQYLERKKISEPFGARFDGPTLYVPVRNANGDIISLQKILEDGSKYFYPNSRTKDGFHVIGDPKSSPDIFLSEGFATAASIHLASGMAAVVAFNANNLPLIAQILREKFPEKRITVCGDDDQWTTRNDIPFNPGRVEAEKAAKLVNRRAIFPNFKSLDTRPTDFNDLHCLEGIKVVTDQLSEANRREDLNGTSSEKKDQKNIHQFGFEIIAIGDLMARPDERIDWVWDGILPAAGTSINGGKPKAGKSTFVRALALKVAQGEPFLGRATHQGPVCYLGFEEKLSEIKTHFKMMGATGSEEILVHAGRAPEKPVDALEMLIERYGFRLVIVDTLFRLVRVSDTNDYAAVTNALEPLTQLARDTGAHIMCLHHLGKGDREGCEAFLGSTAIWAAVDSGLILKRGKDYRTLSSTQRYGQDMEETALVYDENSRSFSLGETREKAEESSIARQILDVLKGQPEPQREDELLNDVEGDTGKKRSVLRQMHRQGTIARTGDGKKNAPYRYKLPGTEILVSPKEPKRANENPEIEEGEV